MGLFGIKEEKNGEKIKFEFLPQKYIMISLSNSLSFIRAPLALLFLQESTTLRFLAILLAMITDSIDGFVARKSKSVSKFGAILDPTMDKFFVYFALCVFFFENKIEGWAALSMLSRDLYLCFFGGILLIQKRWSDYRFRAIRWGKISTALQFFVLMGLNANYNFSNSIYWIFITLGSLAFFELLQTLKEPQKS